MMSLLIVVCTILYTLLTSVTTVLCICIRSIATEGAKNGLYSKGNLILMASDLRAPYANRFAH